MLADPVPLPRRRRCVARARRRGTHDLPGAPPPPPSVPEEKLIESLSSFWIFLLRIYTYEKKPKLFSFAFFYGLYSPEGWEGFKSRRKKEHFLSSKFYGRRTRFRLLFFYHGTNERTSEREKSHFLPIRTQVIICIMYKHVDVSWPRPYGFSCSSSDIHPPPYPPPPLPGKAIILKGKPDKFKITWNKGLHIKIKKTRPNILIITNS